MGRLHRQPGGVHYTPRLPAHYGRTHTPIHRCTQTLHTPPSHPGFPSFIVFQRCLGLTPLTFVVRNSQQLLCVLNRPSSQTLLLLLAEVKGEEDSPTVISPRKCSPWGRRTWIPPLWDTWVLSPHQSHFCHTLVKYVGTDDHKWGRTQILKIPTDCIPPVEEN